MSPHQWCGGPIDRAGPFDVLGISVEPESAVKSTGPPSSAKLATEEDLREFEGEIHGQILDIDPRRVALAPRSRRALNAMMLLIRMIPRVLDEPR